MAPSITIIGGNIAGLSAACYLAEKGCQVTVYEAKIWDKPCGGAISREFSQYLDDHLGIRSAGADKLMRPMQCGFQKAPSILLDPIFVTISRYQLQKDLIARLKEHPNIDIVFKRISLNDRHLFTPQTVLATGFSALTRKIIRDEWHNREYALIYKARGNIDSDRPPDSHLMVFNSRIRGYGWLFIENDGRFNMGTGGLLDKPRLYKEYEKFRRNAFNIYNDSGLREKGRPVIWKIPVALHPDRNRLNFENQNTEFIGVGDVLGLAHPITAAGIEPAWQSGWLLAESYDPVCGRIDIDKYRKLLRKNLRLTSRKPIDRLAAWMLRAVKLPVHERMAYVFLRLNKQSIYKSLARYPWFAMVHDGKQQVKLD
ncbi:MAG TPA: NAD(P)/FAD-dependent oxidoreductase [Desulfosalsimonadaceae bacterium]|nr:NAD(P)/FAD-dependent oxidoreductase [Desulfosalsimonadaceae bacterium]